MYKVWRIIFVTLLVVSISTSVFLTKNHAGATNDESVYFGITFGGTTAEQAKQLIDEVKPYTNLFVVASWTINGGPNGSALTEICDYAVAANMYFIVYFNFIYQNYTSTIGSRYNATTWDDYGVSPWHRPWLEDARDRYGDKFLGAYLYDEPGGKQIDCGYWNRDNSTFSGTPITIYRNASTYADVARIYTSSIARSGSMQVLTNTSYRYNLTQTVPVYTSDYALFWYDYKVGYTAIFTEIGELHEQNRKIEQIALCRGAANAQHKEWGAIITFASYNPPTPLDGATMLNDMKMAYEAGAKYIIAFNYVVDGENGLTDEQFNAMQQFWEYMHAHPETHGKYRGETAYILPTDYGSGLRRANDMIWGFWHADNLSEPIWNNMNALIDQYGLNLDIVYDDPDVSIEGLYSQTYLWNGTQATGGFFAGNQGYVLVPVVGCVGAVACASTIWVTRRKKTKPATIPIPQVVAIAGQEQVLVEQPKPQLKRQVQPPIKEDKLNPIFDAYADIMDALFDVLIGLDGVVNWETVNDAVERCKLAKVLDAKQVTGNLNFHSLTIAVQSQQPQNAAQEAQALIKTLHVNLSNVSGPQKAKVNHTALEGALQAYFLLNDVLLGQVLGDQEVAQEKKALTQILEELTQESIEDEVFSEFLGRLGGDSVLGIKESRSQLRNQLHRFLKAA